MPMWVRVPPPAWGFCKENLVIDPEYGGAEAAGLVSMWSDGIGDRCAAEMLLTTWFVLSPPRICRYLRRGERKSQATSLFSYIGEPGTKR
jgi:hypothetical protein